MKRFAIITAILSMVLISCKEIGEVRIMPEFNYDQTAINISKVEGSSVTALIYTTENNVKADYDADWLSVDVNEQRAIYTAISTNETGEPRVAIVKISAGDFTVEVTVTQSNKDASEERALKVGQLTEDGNGMIFWVDPNDPESGKAISLERWDGAPFEATVVAHGALSAVNGYENTLLFTNAGLDDAVTHCAALGEGWYLPASDELLQLFDAYNGIAHDDPGFKSAIPSEISDAEKAARAAFDKLLTDLGGVIINKDVETGNGNSYWSSTENEDGLKAKYLRVGKYAMDYGAKTSSARSVRCMKVIGNYKFPEEPAKLTVTPTEISLESTEGAIGKAMVTTNKGSFTAVIEGDGSTWLSVTQTADAITFTSLSVNTGDAVRTATVIVTTGIGENQATASITVNQQKAITQEPFKIGDYVNKDGSTILAEGGIVFWVDPTDPTKAKIVSLSRISLKWTDGSVAPIGVTSSDDGFGNTQMIAGSAVAADIPAIAYCQNMGAGWYWPARNELISLYDVYNGDHKTSAYPKDLTPEEKAARAAWDKILTDNGGVKMNEAADDAAGDSYWASTEATAGDKVFYVRFGKYGDTTNAKNGSARFVRCIRNVSK